MNEQRGEKSRSRKIRLDDVSRHAGGRLEGNPDILVHDLVPLHQAGPGEIGFLSRSGYLKHLPETRAEAILVAEDLLDSLPAARPALIVVADPNLALAELIELFHPEPESVPEVHPTAVLGKGVSLGNGVSIGPYAVLGEDTVLGDRVRIEAHVVIGRNSRIGDGSILHPHVVIYPNSVLGERVTLHSGARIGVDGFGYVFHDGEHRKVRQVGGCSLGDDVEIGANSCVDRGSIGRTEIGAGTKLDNLVHLGHNVVVGEKALIVAQTGVSGSTRIGSGAVLGGQVGVAGHLEVGDGARLAGRSGVIGDVPAGETVMGFPARPQREFLRAIGGLYRLPDLSRRIRALEREIRPGRKRDTEAG